MDRNTTLTKYVGDMLAIEREIHSAIEGQLADEHLRKYDEAHALCSRTADTLRRHVQALEQLLPQSESPSAKAKEAIAGAVGFLAGLYGKIRSNEVSKMLRDDYVALNVAVMAYAMLHTTGLALKDAKVAELALSHHNDFPKLIIDFNNVVPGVVARELADGDKTVDITSAQPATANLQRAWQQHPA